MEIASNGGGLIIVAPNSAFWNQGLLSGDIMRVLPFCVVANNVNFPYDVGNQFRNDPAPFANQ